MLLNLATWVPILDGDPAGAAMYERHYSAGRTLARRQASGAMLFLGPGEKLVLMTPCRRAMFAWRFARHRADGMSGPECAIFRNEGAGLSSDLIRQADRIADERWPGEPHFTYVNPALTASRRSRTSRPGECFLRAGWADTGKVSTRGLALLERVAPTD